MTNKLSTRATAAIGFAAMGLFMAANAYAATPTLSLSSVSGGSVQVTVSGDPNASVMFYYNVGSASGMQSATLGTTNANGYFSTTITAASYSINAGQSVYVIVNGQQSAMQAWPAPTGMPSLSQNSVTLGLGQSVSVYSQGSSAAVYVATNSNPSIASVQASGTQITVVGNQIGTANVSICFTGTASNCANLYVTVQSGSALSFNQNNFTLVVGQGTTVVVTGGSGTYSITGNSNTAVASAVLSGSNITVTALATGSTNVAVCDTANGCGTIYVTVSGSSASGQVTFGVTNPTVIVGQNTSISLSGGSGYYVSSNANSNIVQASINGTSLALYGNNAGSSSVTVCASGGSCSTLYITVTSQSTSGQSTSQAALLAAIQSMQSQLAQIVVQIQTMATTLTQLAGSVQSGTGTGGTTAVTGTGAHTFTLFLSAGSQGAEVTALQNYLTQKGFYSGSITGFYGSLTEAAVGKYQTAHGIDPVGYVGPSTRAALNAGK